MKLVDELERRNGSRRREKLPCKMLIDGRSCPGVLRDQAPGGLFVETRDDVPPGVGVIVAFRASGGERFVLEARAPQQRQVSRSLLGVASRGCSLRIQDPPQQYLRWLEAAGRAKG